MKTNEGRSPANTIQIITKRNTVCLVDTAGFRWTTIRNGLMNWQMADMKATEVKACEQYPVKSQSAGGWVVPWESWKPCIMNITTHMMKSLIIRLRNRRCDVAWDALLVLWRTHLTVELSNAPITLIRSIARRACYASLLNDRSTPSAISTQREKQRRYTHMIILYNFWSLGLRTVNFRSSDCLCWSSDHYVPHPDLNNVWVISE